MFKIKVLTIIELIGIILITGKKQHVSVKEVSKWRFQRPEFQNREEINGAAPTGSSRFREWFHARNAAHSGFRTECAASAELMAVVKSLRPKKASSFFV